MRKYLPEFEYFQPSSLKDLLELLDTLEGEVKLLAGGTDLIPAMREKGLTPRYLVSLRNLANDLSYIKMDYEDGKKVLRIGALTTIHSIEVSEALDEKFYILKEAASQLGTYQIRNRATLGGNLCNASPAADMATPLLALNSRLILLSLEGEREVPINEFFLGPGKTVLKRNEILKEVVVEEPRSLGSSFLKVSRKAVGLAIVNVACYLELTNQVVDNIRIALGAVAPTPVRATSLEKELIGMRIDDIDLAEACKKIDEDIKPISDVRASEEYRRHLSRVLTERAVKISLERVVCK
jgi:carbon-monoxide dehydrogenase medium subunit